MVYPQGRNNGIIASVTAQPRKTLVKRFKFPAEIEVSIPEDSNGQSMLQILLSKISSLPVVIEDPDPRSESELEGMIQMTGPITLIGLE